MLQTVRFRSPEKGFLETEVDLDENSTPSTVSRLFKTAQDRSEGVYPSVTHEGTTLYTGSPTWGRKSCANPFVWATRMYHNLRKHTLRIQNGKVFCPGVEIPSSAISQSQIDHAKPLPLSLSWRALLQIGILCTNTAKRAVGQKEIVNFADPEGTFFGSIYRRGQGHYATIHGSGENGVLLGCQVVSHITQV
ncbi:MAG: hypothetical protein QF486_00165 [Candidatus Woesearchaeota archaeon]|jgi:hypothetical protein|nr:hypothetical protein [Candidatus Woesearchaeota archaeon]MDP7181363.1 hypothetical protein [Candidatus Woesearchaeota archaeon]MDP7198019.1 hypothetical protein [Candidatus Woesearchaeota archaeon]MDP7466853.1 hypothetical protein [Candidatus Woesearchaeota archaeon]MDP7647289.1 hypothetical protein [Candidatus Woesearchaeota archaeon]